MIAVDGCLYFYKATVDRIVDADTLDLSIDAGFHVWVKTRVRLYGINAPEIRGADRLKGLAATEALRALIDGKELIVRTYKAHEKFGRWLCVLWVGDLEVNRWLVEHGYAEPFMVS